jgi:hypothetical protein
MVGANSNGVRRTWRWFQAAIRASAQDEHLSVGDAPGGGLKGSRGHSLGFDFSVPLT